MQSNAALMQAMETAYKEIRARHPELGEVILILSPTSRAGRNTKLGHFFRNSWVDKETADTLAELVAVLEQSQDPDERAMVQTLINQQRDGVHRFHEILISAEGLYRGGREVMETLLHEAAHHLALERGQKDVTGYQYHNRTFKRNAEELGLTVNKMKNRGFAHTEMPDETADRYKIQITLLEGVVKALRMPEPKRGSDNGMIKMVCPCGNVVRCGKRVAASGDVWCRGCNHPFKPEKDKDAQRVALDVGRES